MVRTAGEQGMTLIDGRSGRRVLTYEQALHKAIKLFVRDGTVDMQTLADAFPVGRATLYRVAHSRDRLLGDVLWILAERTLELAQAETCTLTGIDRVIETSHRFKEHTLGFEPLRRFLRAEPQTAFRVLLTPQGDVSGRLVRAWIEILQQAVERGEFALPFDVEWFAYVFVRTGESMVYSDLLAGREPDLALAALIQRQLFRPD